MHTVLIGSFSLTYHLNMYCVLDSFFHDDSGLLPSLVGVTHVAIQFPVYEKVKLYFAKRGNKIFSTIAKLDKRLSACM